MLEDIKTINNQTIMGSGNLTVTASTTFGEINGDPEDNGNLKRALDTKANAADVYKKDERWFVNIDGTLEYNHIKISQQKYNRI